MSLPSGDHAYDQTVCPAVSAVEARRRQAGPQTAVPRSPARPRANESDRPYTLRGCRMARGRSDQDPCQTAANVPANRAKPMSLDARIHLTLKTANRRLVFHRKSERTAPSAIEPGRKQVVSCRLMKEAARETRPEDRVSRVVTASRAGPHLSQGVRRSRHRLRHRLAWIRVGAGVGSVTDPIGSRAS